MSKLRVCNKHGIYQKETVSGGCPECKQVSAKIYDSTKRDSELNKFYQSKGWKHIRDRQLMKNPLCVECGRPAKIADHIKEIKDGGAKLSLDNLQSMCVSCHNTKTAKERKDRSND